MKQTHLTLADLQAIAQAEAERYCPVNEHHSLEHHEGFKRLVRENLQGWEELRRRDPVLHAWEVLWAYLCKTDACEDLSSVLVEERLKFARGAALRLIAAHGAERARGISHAITACARLDLANELEPPPSAP